jgi:hypothetical protein
MSARWIAVIAIAGAFLGCGSIKTLNRMIPATYAIL